MEESQKNEVASLYSLFEEGIVVFDTEKRIVFMNQIMLNMIETEESDVTKLSLQEMVDLYIEADPPEKKDVLKKEIESIFMEGFVSLSLKEEIFYVHMGSRRKFSVKIRVAKILVQGNSLGVIIFSNVSEEQELKKYKEETKKNLAKLTLVLEKTATGDFSDGIILPEQGAGDFTELFVGVQLMIDDLVTLSVKQPDAPGEKVTLEQKQALPLQNTGDTSDELQRAKQHIEMVIEHLTTGLIEYDGSFCVKRMNSAAAEILSVNKENIVGLKVLPEHKDQEDKRNLAIVSYPVLAQEGRRINSKSFGENVSIHELFIDYPTRKEIELVTVPLVNERTGDREGFMKVLRDVTKEREISRSKSDFINIAAHQLRTPLSGVKWVLRMILDGDAGVLDPSQRKLLDKGYETNEKMIILVNDLLNVARIDDNRFGYVFKKGNIVTAVSDVVEELRLIAEKGGIDLIFEKPNDVPPSVFDFSKIQLAFHNLIGNAIKYTKEGGTVKILLRKEGDEVVGVVQDTGVGIPKNQIDKMFTKFFRAENVVRLQVGGSGLGLFIVRDIVARHGGSITVESVENEGTTFILKIPLQQIETPIEEPASGTTT